MPRSASKHPDCRSRTGADGDDADQIAAELERDQPPPGLGRDCWFVAGPAPTPGLLLELSGLGAEARLPLVSTDDVAADS